MKNTAYVGQLCPKEERATRLQEKTICKTCHRWLTWQEKYYPPYDTCRKCRLIEIARSR